MLNERFGAYITLESTEIIAETVAIEISPLTCLEGEIIDLPCTCGLVIAIAITVDISPLGRVIGEIVDLSCSNALVIAPAVVIAVVPLARIVGKGVATIGNGPILVGVRPTITIGIGATPTVV